MARIKGRDTQPEMILRKKLWAMGIRYRVDHKTRFGRVDIAQPGRKVAVQVDGCFWHGCPDHYVRPQSREEFWSRKLRENVDRDRRQTIGLEGEGWTVIRIWEHEVVEDPEGCASAVAAHIRSREIRKDDWRVVEVVEIDCESAIEERCEECLRRPDETRRIRRYRQTRKTGKPENLQENGNGK